MPPTGLRRWGALHSCFLNNVLFRCAAHLAQAIRLRFTDSSDFVPHEVRLFPTEYKAGEPIWGTPFDEERLSSYNHLSPFYQCPRLQTRPVAIWALSLQTSVPVLVVPEFSAGQQAHRPPGLGLIHAGRSGHPCHSGHSSRAIRAGPFELLRSWVISPQQMFLWHIERTWFKFQWKFCIQSWRSFCLSFERTAKKTAKRTTKGTAVNAANI